MTRGRRKHWRVRLAFEPNRYSSEQLERTYEQLTPIDARSTRRIIGCKAGNDDGREARETMSNAAMVALYARVSSEQQSKRGTIVTLPSKNVSVTESV